MTKVEKKSEAQNPKALKETADKRYWEQADATCLRGRARCPQRAADARSGLNFQELNHLTARWGQRAVPFCDGPFSRPITPTGFRISAQGCDGLPPSVATLGSSFTRVPEGLPHSPGFQAWEMRSNSP